MEIILISRKSTKANKLLNNFGGLIMGDIFENLKNINKRFCSKWFIKYSDLDEKQKEIYNEENSFIALGCAGSGKSVLAIHKLLKLLKKIEIIRW